MFPINIQIEKESWKVWNRWQGSAGMGRRGDKINMQENLLYINSFMIEANLCFYYKVDVFFSGHGQTYAY